jgi:hypothetical protein
LATTIFVTLSVKSFSKYSCQQVRSLKKEVRTGSFEKMGGCGGREEEGSRRGRGREVQNGGREERRIPWAVEEWRIRIGRAE